MGDLSPRKVSLEVKSFFDDTKYHLTISGHFDVVLEIALHLKPDLKHVIEEIETSYMPQHFYDDLGSNVRRFANRYIRITHVTKRSHTEEISVFSREQLCDVLLNENWRLIGFTSNMDHVIVEKWMKTLP